jgi:ferritin-like metal-binding protein YciE
MKISHVGTVTASSSLMQTTSDPAILGEMVAELAILLYAERRRIKRLEVVSKEMSEKEVARLLMCHRIEAERHVERLERAFAFLGQPSFERSCPHLDEIFAHGEVACAMLMGEARDAVQLAVTRQLQNYRATSYRRALAFAVEAKLDRVATMLRANFQEETAAGIELERYSAVRLAS